MNWHLHKKIQIHFCSQILILVVILIDNHACFVLSGTLDILLG